VRILLLTVLFGCTASPHGESLIVRLAVWGPLARLSPHDEPGLASIAQPWVFEKLVSLDGVGNLRPALAARVTRLPGGRISLELRHDATFSDGDALRLPDVVRSVENAGLRVVAADGEFVVESRDGAIPTDALLIRTSIYRESGGAFLGSGPFVVTAETEYELRLVRRSPQRGRINEVRILSYPTSRDAFAHTLKGDANVIADLEARWLEFFQGVPSLRIVRSTGRSTDSIMFNMRIPREERVQLAAALASDHVRQLAYGDAKCAEGGIGDTPESLLPAGTTLRVLNWGPFERLALAARRALGDRGGELSTVTPRQALSRLKDGDFDLVTARPLAWPPSALSFNWRTGSPDNLTGYSNPAFDRALDAQDWSAAQQALRDDPPAAFVCTREQLAVVDARIKNATLGPYDLLETLPDWEVMQ